MIKRLYKACLVYLISFIIVIALLITVIGISFYSAPDSSGPKSISELCSALGRDPESDPMCKWRRLSELLLDTFPIGETKKEEVDQMLGKYLLSSRERPIGGYLDSFAIHRVVCCIRHEANFTYNEDGILIHIIIYD